MLNFSTVICVYYGDNHEWVREAVNSVIDQTVRPSEIVVVIDGPIPCDIENVLSGYVTDPTFRIVRLEKNMGHGYARKAGLDNCSNEIVAIMDSDDICSNDRFEKQIRTFENNDQIDVVGGNIAEFIGDITNIVSYRTVPQSDEEIKEYMKTRCPMNLVTVMFKKSSVERAGGFIDWYCEEDYYLWIRMALGKMVFANVPDVLVNVRVGKEMYKRRGGWRYFQSERKLQKYMRSSGLISFGCYVTNVVKRFIVQVLLPPSIRGVVFRLFARERVGYEKV